MKDRGDGLVLGRAVFQRQARDREQVCDVRDLRALSSLGTVEIARECERLGEAGVSGLLRAFSVILVLLPTRTERPVSPSPPPRSRPLHKGCDKGCETRFQPHETRAGEGIRTLDVHLGKVALYH